MMFRGACTEGVHVLDWIRLLWMLCVQASDRPSTISVYMTLRPRLQPPIGEPDEQVAVGEQEDVVRHARAWLSGLMELPQCR